MKRAARKHRAVRTKSIKLCLSKEENFTALIELIGFVTARDHFHIK